MELHGQGMEVTRGSGALGLTALRAPAPSLSRSKRGVALAWSQRRATARGTKLIAAA